MGYWAPSWSTGPPACAAGGSIRGEDGEHGEPAGGPGEEETSSFGWELVAGVGSRALGEELG